jgi:hypothetical protein
VYQENDECKIEVLDLRCWSRSNGRTFTNYFRGSKHQFDEKETVETMIFGMERSRFVKEIQEQDYHKYLAELEEKGLKTDTWALPA